MNIELVGLPAVGKSTLAKELGKTPRTRSIAAPRGGMLALFALCGMLARPASALALRGLIRREKDPAIRRSLLTNALFGASAKYALAGSSSIIDQGYVQSAVAALPLADDAEAIAAVLRGIPRHTLVVWCETAASVRAQRIGARTRAPRAEFGAAEAARFAAQAPEAYALVKSVAEKVLPAERQLTLDPADPQSLEKIHSALGRLGRPPASGSGHSGIHAFAKLLMFSFAYLISKLLTRSSGALVLMYHAIDRSGWKLAVAPETFERQMAYLARCKGVVSLADVVAYAKGERGIAKNAVAVTFDDGYRDVLTTVLPLIKKYKIPITIFVPSDLAVHTDHEGRARLSWEELRTLQASGLVSIESHAATHRKFPELTREEMQAELEDSARVIERELGVRPRYFAYPFGARSAEAEEVVAESAYEAAFGITDGVIRRGMPLYRLPRVQIDATMRWSLFRLRTTAAVEVSRRIVKALRAMIPV
jgi:peptidoglycan/xylan/chitin deacetylase (PgdA/CDA1 family)/predicted kinase